MATPRTGLPYLYVTWLTGLLSGEDSCLWAAHFKARFTHKQKPRSFDLAAWSADHGVKVRERAEVLRNDGWSVGVEDQNAFRLSLNGQIMLAGKPDLIAVRGIDVRIEDVKTGKPKDKDLHQILLYFYAFPKAHPHLANHRVSGTVLYNGHVVDIAASRFDDARRKAIVALLKRIADPLAPERTPSSRECGFCSIDVGDCPERIDAETAVVDTEF